VHKGLDIPSRPLLAASSSRLPAIENFDYKSVNIPFFTALGATHNGFHRIDDDEETGQQMLPRSFEGFDGPDGYASLRRTAKTRSERCT
jgi:hypothetical protein